MGGGCQNKEDGHDLLLLRLETKLIQASRQNENEKNKKKTYDGGHGLEVVVLHGLDDILRRHDELRQASDRLRLLGVI